MNVCIGVDLGGTKIEIIALADDGKEILRRRLPTPQGDYHGILNVIVQLVHESEAELGERKASLEALEEVLGHPLTVSPDAHYMGAIGAAIFAMEKLGQSFESGIWRTEYATRGGH